MKKEPYDIEQINVMSWLRFPLIMGVVLAHCNLYAIVSNWEGCTSEMPSWLVFIFNELYLIVLPARVPTLFIISGYFFFRTLNDKKANGQFFIDKYKKRVSSLLVPYLIWNCIAIAMLYVKYDIIEQTPLNFIDYLSGFWDFIPRAGFDPANGPLWYMRDLMVITLMSPLVYVLINNKRTVYIYLSILSVLYATNICLPLVGFSNDAFLFFSIGAYIAIHNVNLTKISNKTGLIMLLLYIPSQLFFNRLEENNQYIYVMYLIVSIIKITAVFYLVSLLFSKKILKPTPRLGKISFLLYALHGVIVNPIIMVLFKLSGYTDNPFLLLGIYITTPIIIIVATQLLYTTITKFTPGIAKAVTGNRG
jgi:peptidoglycan/LPS O-acetylase OafA/YrhL